MKKFIAVVSFLAVSMAYADTPKLDLLVRETGSGHEMSAWIFEVSNTGLNPVNVSDLEIRFWVYEPNKRLIGLHQTKDGWQSFRGIVNGEAVMCAFLSPTYDIVPNRKANYAIRYRTAEDKEIQPGDKWRVKFGYALLNKEFLKLPITAKNLPTKEKQVTPFYGSASMMIRIFVCTIGASW